MPTIIDELVIQLGLDASKFTAGQKAAMESFKKAQDDSVSRAKVIEAAGARASQFFTKLRTEALGFAALLIGGRGLKEFVEHVTVTDAAVGRLAKTMDLSGAELSRWRTAAYLAGGSSEGITTSLQGLTSEIQSFQLTGQSSLLPYLNQLGTGFTDANGKVKTATQLYLDVADALSKLDPARAAEFGKALHLDNDGINLIIRGRQELQRLLNTAARLNPVTNENIDLAGKLQRGFRELETSTESYGRALLEDLSPALETSLGWLTRVFEYATKARDAFRKEGGLAGSVGRLWDYFTGGKPYGGAGSLPASVPKASGSGDVSLGTLALKSALESEFPGIRITALNDAYHAGTGSKHAQGLAIDFAIPDPSRSAEIAAKIRAKLGAGAYVQDEYLNPSARSTGPHIHVQFNTPEAAAAFYGKGGAANGGNVDNRKTSSSEIKIGTVVVNTQAKDAGGIARDFVGAVDDAAKANYGLA